MQLKNTRSHLKKEKPGLIWLNVLLFSITFAIASIGVPVYSHYIGFDAATIITAIIALIFCELSITAGYHRLWSHRSYEANVVVRFICAIGGAFAIQNSAYHWCSDHRIHHQHVDDNETDPYSAKRGFWYSHIGWMLHDYQIPCEHDYKNVRDLKRDPIVMWQHKHYLLLVLLTNLGIPILFGLYNGNVWGSLLLIGVFRLVLSHHLTFFINSLAHMWGTQPYNDKNTAKDNPIVALLTFGEGYHNFHHAFQYDYRNAIKWWQFDPTKWLIKGLSLVGLAKNLKKISEEKIALSIAKQQLTQTRGLLKKLNLPNKDEILETIHAEYDQLIKAMAEFHSIKKEWIETAKGQLLENVEKNSLYQNYIELKTTWFNQRRSWHTLIHQYA